MANAYMQELLEKLNSFEGLEATLESQCETELCFKICGETYRVYPTIYENLSASRDE